MTFIVVVPLFFLFCVPYVYIWRSFSSEFERCPLLSPRSCLPHSIMHFHMCCAVCLGRHCWQWSTEVVLLHRPGDNPCPPLPSYFLVLPICLLGYRTWLLAESGLTFWFFFFFFAFTLLFWLMASLHALFSNRNNFKLFSKIFLVFVFLRRFFDIIYCF